MENNFKIEPIIPLTEAYKIRIYNSTHEDSKMSLFYLSKKEIKEYFNIDIDEA